MHRALLAILLHAPALAIGATNVMLVEGLPGDPLYAGQFERQTQAIEQAAGSISEAGRIRVLRGDAATRDAVLEQLGAMAATLSPSDQFLLFLIGHGSYDDFEYKFNVPGPDLTGADLVAALDALPAGVQVLVNTSSSSGAIADMAGADGRVVVLATRSGAERHATRFGNYFAAALDDDAADTDKNQRISVAEAFRYAERAIDDHFERNDQLATEHPVLLGEQAERIALARLGAARPPVVDTALADLLAERDALNAEIDALRLARDDMEAADYQSALLEKMLQLARLEDAIESREEELGDR